MSVFRLTYLVLITISLGLIGLAAAQPPQGPPAAPPAKKHTVTQSTSLKTISATEPARGINRVWIEIKGDDRVIRANGIPNHATGSFPNKGNPNRIAKQSYAYRVPLKPTAAEQITPVVKQPFGIAINGIPFDPSAAEWYLGKRNSKWQYEPLSGAIALGIDTSHAHVRPNGAYHYHGLPTNLLSEVKLDSSGHSPIVGWAADGFPIYAVYGHSISDDQNSDVRTIKSSFRLKQGERPGGVAPGGHYDGTFIADYEFEEGRGDLDECNGRYCVTPDYPEGTYAYFLTQDWPVIPRNFRGIPSRDFKRKRADQGRGPQPGVAHDWGQGNRSGHGVGLRPRPSGQRGQRPSPTGR